MYPAAIYQFDLAMQKVASNGSKFVEGFYCANLGCCHSKAGQHATAIVLWEKGLQIFQILKERTSQGQAHSHLVAHACAILCQPTWIMIARWQR